MQYLHLLALQGQEAQLEQTSDTRSIGSTGATGSADRNGATGSSVPIRAIGSQSETGLVGATCASVNDAGVSDVEIVLNPYEP